MVKVIKMNRRLKDSKNYLFFISKLLSVIISEQINLQSLIELK